jgi:hypothetical protein
MMMPAPVHEKGGGCKQPAYKNNAYGKETCIIQGAFPLILEVLFALWHQDCFIFYHKL